MVSTMFAAAVGQDPADPGQLSQRLTQLVAVAVQRVGGAVDESADRAGRHAVVRAQFRCQPHQLLFDFVPFDRHGGAFDRNHRTVAHRRAATRRRARVGRNAPRPGSGRRSPPWRRRERECRGRRAGSSWPGCRPAGSSRCVPTFTPAMRTSSPGIDRGRRGEVGGDRLGPEEGLLDDDGARRQRAATASTAASPSFSSRFGVIGGGPHCSPGPGIPLYGKGSSARGPALSGGWPALVPRRKPNA